MTSAIDKLYKFRLAARTVTKKHRIRNFKVGFWLRRNIETRVSLSSVCDIAVFGVQWTPGIPKVGVPGWFSGVGNVGTPTHWNPGIKLVYEGHLIKVKVTGAEKVGNSYSRNVQLRSAITSVLSNTEPWCLRAAWGFQVRRNEWCNRHLCVTWPEVETRN